MSNIISNILNISMSKFPEAILFSDWSDFKSKLEVAKTSPDEQTFCKEIGIDHTRYTKMISDSIQKWRISPTQSLLRGLEGVDGAKEGKPIFRSLLEQTRFITSARPIVGTLSLGARPIIQKGDLVKVANTRALTADQKPVNNVLKMLYAYYYWNALKTIKIPKVLYRGVRFSDLFSHPEIEKLIKSFDYGDRSFRERHQVNVNIVVDYIIAHGLQKISETTIVSTSTSQSVAKFFANGAGMIMRIDPKRVHIMTSEQHDDRLQGGSYDTNYRDEKEYIIAIPEDYNWTRDDIIIHSLDYFHAENSPLFVSLMDHDDYAAHYTMNDTQIVVKCWWKNNTSLIQRFNGMSRGEFKKSHHFDPMPTPNNLNQITNFEIRKARSNW
jgi:hypothetical protein